MRARATIIPLVSLVLGVHLARAEDPLPAPASESMPASSYPDEWCIRSYVSRAAIRSVATRPRGTPPPAELYRPASAPVEDPVPGANVDRASLLQRLKELKSLRFATLWRGRDRAVVLGIQDGGYLGFSLDDTTDTDE